MRSVLIVDDNLAFADNLAEILDDAGVAHADVVDCGARALERIARGRYDAMLTDMRMPHMNGAELVHAARRVDPWMPIVVVTAYAGDELLSGALRDGLLSVVSKPAPIERLVRLVVKARPGVVALVDDDAALVDNLAEALRDRGLSSVSAGSLSEIDRLGVEPCVAIVDMRMPGGPDGVALDALARRFPEAARVVVTAFTAEVQIPAEIARFEKPFETQRLVATVEQLCDARRQRQIDR